MMMAIFVLFLSAICFQLFTYCHAGSQLTSEVMNIFMQIRVATICTFSQSIAVSDAIFNSHWYDARPMTKKAVLFFLMRSQRGVVISFGFYVASLETYIAVSLHSPCEWHKFL